MWDGDHVDLGLSNPKVIWADGGGHEENVFVARKFMDSVKEGRAFGRLKMNVPGNCKKFIKGGTAADGKKWKVHGADPTLGCPQSV